jgi:hypothetical protein
MNTTFPTLSAPSAGACLDDLLASRFLPRRWASRIWTANELPVRLARCARSLAPGSEWRAYGDDGHVLFAIARTHKADPPRDSEAAIDVFFLDDHAAVYSAGVWQYDHRHGWCLDALLDLSYDCEHGWWLDALMSPPPTPVAPSGAAKRDTMPLQLKRLSTLPVAPPMRPRRASQ